MIAIVQCFCFGQQATDRRLVTPEYRALSNESGGERKDRDEPQNLIANGDFEKGLQGWKVNAWAKKGHATPDSAEIHDGHPSLRITNPAGDNTFVSQKVRVKRGTHYRMSCWIKTDGIVLNQGKGNAGGTVWIAGGWEATKAVGTTEDWTYVSFDFDSGKRTEIELGPRLGQWGSIVTGTAWFAKVSLVEAAREREQER